MPCTVCFQRTETAESVEYLSNELSHFNEIIVKNVQFTKEIFSIDFGVLETPFWGFFFCVCSTLHWAISYFYFLSIFSLNSEGQTHKSNLSLATQHFSLTELFTTTQRLMEVIRYIQRN
jgi:hypothetical protein